MDNKLNYKSVDKKKIDRLVDVLPKKIKKSKNDYDLVGRMPEKMQKRYFNTNGKNK